MMIDAPLGVVLTIKPPPGVSGNPFDICISGPCEFGFDRDVLIVIGPPDVVRGYRTRNVNRWENCDIRIIAPTESEKT